MGAGTYVHKILKLRVKPVGGGGGGGKIKRVSQFEQSQ